MRLFIALPLEPSVKDALGRNIALFKQKGGSVKWVKAENIHLTLRFLGETDENLVDEIKKQIDEAVNSHRQVKTSIATLGGFPNLNRPRVIWVGIEQNIEALSKMARDIEHRMRSLGFEKEKKQFKAHLTLGRVRHPKGLENLTDFLNDYRFEAIPLCFDRVILFKSTLTPQGPIYDRLHEAKLSAQ
ncbi:MAG: RNA 2',3'-cyclic phosphodiesterase [Candidatus Zixiibacteriota bacterium]|nr:MAG: RNA 2',3'-cyclic phosphodiesterase [candidate division Zixibacteria bacterium]